MPQLNEKNNYCLCRTYKAEIRAAEPQEGESGNIIEGLAVVHDTETTIYDEDQGLFVEVIKRGALDKTDLTDVKFFINHDTNGINLARFQTDDGSDDVAHSRRNNGAKKPNTMHISVDEVGLKVRVNLDIENNYKSKALKSAVDRGDMDGMSFMMYVPKDGEEWEMRDGVKYRTITKIAKIWEVSAVNFPAYPTTTLNSRSLDSDRRALENANKLLESRKQDAEKQNSLQLAALKLRNEILTKLGGI